LVSRANQAAAFDRIARSSRSWRTSRRSRRSSSCSSVVSRVGALARVKRRLLHPVPDRLRRGLELAGQFFRRPPFGPVRRSAGGTPANTADGSSASWTFLSAPTMGCPRNRVNSRRYGFNSLRCDVQRASHRAFAEITQAGAGALTDLEGGVFWTERKRLVELAVKSRLPAVYARPLGGRLPSTQCPPKRGAE